MLLETMLTLSTAHMTEADDDLLRNYAEACRMDESEYTQWIVDTGYGYIIRVNLTEEYIEEQDAEITDMGLSDGVLGAVRFARYHEARWVRFDRDGDIVPELPTWEW